MHWSLQAPLFCDEELSRKRSVTTSRLRGEVMGEKCREIDALWFEIVLGVCWPYTKKPAGGDCRLPVKEIDQAAVAAVLEAGALGAFALCFCHITQRGPAIQSVE